MSALACPPRFTLDPLRAADIPGSGFTKNKPMHFQSSLQRVDGHIECPHKGSCHEAQTLSRHNRFSDAESRATVMPSAGEKRVLLTFERSKVRRGGAQRPRPSVLSAEKVKSKDLTSYGDPTRWGAKLRDLFNDPGNLKPRALRPAPRLSSFAHPKEVSKKRAFLLRRASLSRGVVLLSSRRAVDSRCAPWQLPWCRLSTPPVNGGVVRPAVNGLLSVKT